MAFPVEAKLDPVMDQSLCAHPFADAGLIEHIRRLVLKDTCPNPSQHIVAVALLDDQGIDAATRPKFRVIPVWSLVPS